MTARSVGWTLGGALAATVLVGWLTMPALRARLHLASGRPLHAWEAALRAAPSTARDDLLVRIMLAPVADDAGESTTLWRGVLCTGLDSVRDPREPSWVRFGPNGKAVEAFLSDLRGWPLLSCADVEVADDDPVLAWRWIEFRGGEPDRHQAELGAYQTVYDRIITAGGTGERNVQLATVAGHMAAATAYAVWSGDPDAGRYAAMGAMLRWGHLPRPGEEGGDMHCVLCGKSFEEVVRGAR